MSITEQERNLKKIRRRKEISRKIRLENKRDNQITEEYIS